MAALPRRSDRGGQVSTTDIFLSAPCFPPLFSTAETLSRQLGERSLAARGRIHQYAWTQRSQLQASAYARGAQIQASRTSPG